MRAMRIADGVHHIDLAIERRPWDLLETRACKAGNHPFSCVGEFESINPEIIA